MTCFLFNTINQLHWLKRLSSEHSSALSNPPSDQDDYRESNIQRRDFEINFLTQSHRYSQEDSEDGSQSLEL